MADFDFLGYQKALQIVKDDIAEMDRAVDGLQFEHGQGGISGRAAGFLDELNTALRDASIHQAAVLAIIVKETE